MWQKQEEMDAIADLVFLFLDLIWNMVWLATGVVALVVGLCFVASSPAYVLLPFAGGVFARLFFEKIKLKKIRGEKTTTPPTTKEKDADLQNLIDSIKNSMQQHNQDV